MSAGERYPIATHKSMGGSLRALGQMRGRSASTISRKGAAQHGQRRRAPREDGLRQGSGTGDAVIGTLPGHAARMHNHVEVCRMESLAMQAPFFERVETARLVLRRPCAPDIDAVVAIHGDPGTNKFNPRGPSSFETCRELLSEWRAHWQVNSFGDGSVALRNDAESIMRGLTAGRSGPRSAPPTCHRSERLNGLVWSCRTLGWHMAPSNLSTIMKGGDPSASIHNYWYNACKSMFFAVQAACLA